MKKLFLFIILYVSAQSVHADTLTVTFLDGETSNPIEGVSGFINSYAYDVFIPVQFITDSDGQVVVSSFPEGAGDIWASAPGYSEIFIPFVFPDQSDLVIAMLSGSTNNVIDTLNIQIVDSETGDPIADVFGSAYSASFWDYLIPFNTDEDGLASLYGFPTGQTEIWASANGYIDLYDSFYFSDQDLIVLEMDPSEIPNEETDTLSIQFVHSETGAPIQNVNGFINSYVTWMSPFQFVTDASGTVEIHNFPYGSAELHANANGYYDIFMSFNFSDQDQLVIEMSPYETPPFETDTLKMVFINSETGDIIPSVEGYAMSFGAWDMVYTYEFMSNELGYAEIYNFPLGLAEVYAFKIGFADSYQYFEFTGDESANIPGGSDIITISMDPVGPPDYQNDTLTIQFVDAVTGLAVPDVGGYLMSNVGNDWTGSWSTTFYSDNEGTAVIPVVPYGNIDIYASGIEYLEHYSSISFPDQDNIQITLFSVEQTTNATISGNVTMPEGAQSFFPPIVFAVNMDSTNTTYQNFVSENGGYALPVSAGDYQIGALTLLSGGSSFGIQMQFYENASTIYDATQVSVAEGEFVENINFTFSNEDMVFNTQYGNMVMGQVGNENGATMENTHITIKNQNGMTVSEGSVNASQMYMLSGLDQGQFYIISATHDSYGTVEEVFTSNSMMSIKNFEFSASPLSTEHDIDQVPTRYNLEQNFPNPFNPVTTLRYSVPEQELVNISVFDMRGNLVKNLVNSFQSPGEKTVRWNATDSRNNTVSAGVYLYKIQAGIFSQTKKMILLK